MKWASALSEQTPLSSAIDECIGSINRQLDGATANLAVVFASFHYQEQFEDIPGLIREQLDSPLVLGCSGGGIIGNGLEVEQQPALSITVASLPNVTLKAFRLEGDSLPDLDAGPQNWEDLVQVVKSDEPQFILLADPYSFPVQNLILGLDFAFEQSAKIGGLASGAQQAGQNALFLDDKVFRSGAVGVAMSGNVVVDTVVAQGCRPIGKPMRITQSQRNLLGGLDGRPPVEVLRELFDGLNERDRGLMRTSLFLGVVMDEFIDEPKQGDFLIRNVMGMDDRAGVLAIGETLKEGQLVQFHLRDAETSTEDLVAVLDRYAGENRENQARGALLFSCLGRGQYLYGKPNHDTAIFQDKLGSVPLGGFFCNGEIGPVSGTTFLHGYTSSFGIFRPKY
ncbi:MAG: FIST C-terminal domain-containing protein [Chloroflexi bacterium]|nr:FIST C-terminal domain-containing protein [Chloroflexota bacterium]MDA1219998.1 FIST C-terminal domain-containing protein [Chloroflexota bacterium]